jgi:ribonuclease HII
MLKTSCTDLLIEAGCDEAGRGCLAGPVFAAAVILPFGFKNPDFNDSKKLTLKQREKLRVIIEKEAVAWAVAFIDNKEIDKINILNASILAMHHALDMLLLKPELILVDGNRFKPYSNIQHQTIVRGDGIYMSIAAASILAKTHRDEYMLNLHDRFPDYGWNTNKGYPTLEHRKAILNLGFSPYHRQTFTVQLNEKEIDLEE